MKFVYITCILLATLSSCSKKEDEKKDGTPKTAACQPNSNLCFTLNGRNVAFQSTWTSLLGNQMGVRANNDSVDFGMDIGTKLEKRSYQIKKGSMASPYSRISYYDKKNKITYTAISGTLTITDVSNNKLTGNFNGVFQDDKSNSYDVNDGKLVAIGE